MKLFVLLLLLIVGVSASENNSCIRLLVRLSQEHSFRLGKAVDLGDLETSSRHATEVHLAQLENGTKAIFKPNLEGVRASSSKHEVAAYLLSRELELDFVPFTIERSINGRLGSLQLMIEDGVTATLKEGRFFYADYPSSLRSRELYFFDFLTANYDRHSDNFLFDSRGKLWAIDNGAAFLIDTDSFRKLERLFVRDYENLRLPTWRIRKLEELNEQKLRGLLENYLGETELLNLLGRRRAYLEYFSDFSEL